MSCNIQIGKYFRCGGITPPDREYFVTFVKTNSRGTRNKDPRSMEC